MANFGGNPEERWTWVAPGQSIGAAGQTVRGAAQNQEADDALAANQGMLLWISFERDGQQTWQPIGENARVFVNLVGSAIRNCVPCYFDSWRNVPQHYKDEVLQIVKGYFNLQWYHDHHELDPIRVGGVAGFEATCAERYRAAKTRFKKAWYTRPLQSMNLQQLRMHPPPGMSHEMWNDHVDFFSGERRQCIAQVNTHNRQQLPYVARQGRRSNARRRDAYREETGHYPPSIDHWADMHTRGGIYISDLAQEQHDQMAQLWEQSHMGLIPHMSEDEIMDQVLHTRPWYRKGRGRIVAGVPYAPEIAHQPSPQFVPDMGDYLFSDMSESPGESSGARNDDSDD